MRRRRFFSLFLHRPGRRERGACSSQPRAPRASSKNSQPPHSTFTHAPCHFATLCAYQPTPCIATLKNYERVPFKIINIEEKRIPPTERKKKDFWVLARGKKTWAETAEIKGHKSSNVIKMDGVIWC
jgi:hypothetical protein